MRVYRDIEIKNNLTVIRGEVGGEDGGKWERDFRNSYKGHMDITKRGVYITKRGGGWGWLACGGVGGGNADNCT